MCCGWIIMATQVSLLQLPLIQARHGVINKYNTDRKQKSSRCEGAVRHCFEAVGRPAPVWSRFHVTNKRISLRSPLNPPAGTGLPSLRRRTRRVGAVKAEAALSSGIAHAVEAFQHFLQIQTGVLGALVATAAVVLAAIGTFWGGTLVIGLLGLVWMPIQFVIDNAVLPRLHEAKGLKTVDLIVLTGSAGLEDDFRSTILADSRITSQIQLTLHNSSDSSTRDLKIGTPWLPYFGWFVFIPVPLAKRNFWPLRRRVGVPKDFETGAVTVKILDNSPALFKKAGKFYEKQGQIIQLVLSILSFGWWTSPNWQLHKILLDGSQFPCYSWVRNTHPRVVFQGEAALPSKTPEALKPLRKQALAERQKEYAFDIYDDLSNPNPYTSKPGDKGYRKPLVPFPRRQITHFEPGSNGPNLAKPLPLPLDDAFRRAKNTQFLGLGLVVATAFSKAPKGPVTSLQDYMDLLEFTRIAPGQKREPPLVLTRESSDMWKEDKEFGRQVVAGMNPIIFQHLTPEKAAADEDLLGLVLGLTEADLPKALSSVKSAKDLLDAGRLFVLDYRALEDLTKGTALYPSVCILYSLDGELMPLAIRLEKGGTVYSAGKAEVDDYWTWLLAKAYVANVDSNVHQVGSHFTRCHACSEVVLIALRRQLSEKHPVFKLLIPHYRYTMQINASARQQLINADGVIESTFGLNEETMYAGAALYSSWTFRAQGLKKDLELRGVDSHETLKSYPYRDVGMEIFGYIEEYVKDYLSLYYKSDAEVVGDVELQAWWKDFKAGHADLLDVSVNGKKQTEAEIFGELNTIADLEEVATTLIWVPSGMHSALNFGQFDYMGYAPNRPSRMNNLMPAGGIKSEKELVACLPTLPVATSVIQTVELLTTHAGDEVFLGNYYGEDNNAEYWLVDKKAKDVNYAFSQKMVKLQKRLTEQYVQTPKEDVPYLYLYPSLDPAIALTTGIPNSVSI